MDVACANAVIVTRAMLFTTRCRGMQGLVEPQLGLRYRMFVDAPFVIVMQVQEGGIRNLLEKAAGWIERLRPIPIDK